MPDDPTPPPAPAFELYELYLGTAEKVSDRRAAANTWMLSVNAAVVALYGYLGGDKAVVEASERLLWLAAIPAAGILICLSWASLLASYSKLNGAKFAVLKELEAQLAFPVFQREQEIYKAQGRRPFGWAEKGIPLVFIVLYAVLLAGAVGPSLLSTFIGAEAPQ